MPAPEGTLGEALTDAAKDGLLDLAVGYVTAGLGDFLYASTELPGFLADTTPVTSAALPLKEITRLACRTYARGGGPQNLPGFDAVWGGICEPYLDSIGENPLPGSVARPFTGGQCYGENYAFDFTFTNNQGSRQTLAQQTTGRLIGTYSVDIDGQDSWNFGFERQATEGGPVVRVSQGTTFGRGNPNPVISNVVLAGGGDDSCGSPPIVFDPPKVRPGLPTLPPSTPIDFPGIGPIGVDITFDPDGTINVNLPDIGVEVGVEDPFGLGGGGDGGAPPSGPPPGDVGSPGTPVGVGAGGEEEGQAPEGAVLVGLRVQIVGVPNSRAKYTEDVFRGAYYAYMGVPNLLDLDFGGSMVRQDQFLFAERDNLTNWRVKANTGYELITTPYYRQVEE